MTTTMLGAPMVSIRTLAKSYGENHVLRGIDIEIAEREVVCVIGPYRLNASCLLQVVCQIRPGLDLNRSELYPTNEASSPSTPTIKLPQRVSMR